MDIGIDNTNPDDIDKLPQRSWSKEMETRNTIAENVIVCPSKTTAQLEEEQAHLREMYYVPLSIDEIREIYILANIARAETRIDERFRRKILKILYHYDRSYIDQYDLEDFTKEELDDIRKDFERCDKPIAKPKAGV